MKRFGQPEEVAAAVAFLASPGASCATVIAFGEYDIYATRRLALL